MNARLLSSALPSIKTLVYLSCLLSTGCAFHNSKPTSPPSAETPASQQRMQRHEQPVEMSKPPASVPPPQPKHSVSPAPKPAPTPTPAIDKAPATNAPIAATRPTPAQSGTTTPPAPAPKAKPAPQKPEQPKSEPLKPQTTDSEPHKPATATTAPAIEPATPATPATPAADVIAVDLNKLPLSIHGQWTLDRDESRCTLQSAVQHMDDGQGGTRISLWLTAANEMHFVTESDIDLSYTGTGVTIDGGPHFDLETVEHRTNPVFSKQRNALLSAMKNAKTLELTLGFWPSWPVTHTYSASFPLQHFATAYAAWESCNTQLH